MLLASWLLEPMCGMKALPIRAAGHLFVQARQRGQTHVPRARQCCY